MSIDFHRDPRHIANGFEIPSETYADQPYIITTDDGAWLCVMTTGSGHEGDTGQHIVTTRSTDLGHTWSPPVAVEPSDGPEASYAVLLKIPGGRVYCFYNHNTDNLRQIQAEEDGDWAPGGIVTRVDSQGYFVFKFSDDHGRSWSSQRTVLPLREMDMDRGNVYGGRIRFFWNVGRPFLHEGAAYVSVHKVGGFGHGFFIRSEGVQARSANLLTEKDPAKITWETLPDGEIGLRTPPGGGPIAEEQSYSVLSDGSFYCVYRSIDGHPVFAYSRDRGHTWSEPRYKRYADGRLMKHPRAANFAWRCENGHFLYWFHNHGGRWYEERNPVWLSGGVEVDSPEGKVIQWSQPEIVLYDDDPYIRMSYPDLVEADGRYFLTETQKDLARVHEVDAGLLASLWGQFDRTERATDGLILDLPVTGQAVPAQIDAPAFPAFSCRSSTRADHGTDDLRNGFTLDLWLHFDNLGAGQTVLDNRTPSGQGLAVQTANGGTLEIILNDGRTENRWDCDPGLLTTQQEHHVAIVVDGGPKLILFVVDGVLCDGGDFRQFGWGRFSPHLRHVTGEKALTLGPCVRGLGVYERALRVSEAIANYRSENVHP
jgi:hypothetical protein